MNKRLKKILGMVLTIILIIALSVATTLSVNKYKAVQASATIKDGLSAYEIAVSEGYKGSLQDWLISLNGKSAYETAKESGFDGTEEEYGELLNKLATSDPITVKTAYFNKSGQLVITLSDDTTINAGKAVGLDGENGIDGKDGTNGKDGIDGVGITNANINDDGELILSFSNNSSINVGKIVGTTGVSGKDGLSAYQIAVISGATTASTESEWIAGLKGNNGARGEKGDKGDKGDTGSQGDKGDTGATGKSAYELAIDNGIITKMVTETQWLNSLKGDKGDTGAQGEKGEKGLGIQNIALANGTMTVTLTDSSSYTFENINGKDGISPQIRINTETNKWEISTDNGTTWVSTNVKATGSQGEKGDKGDKGDTGPQGEKGDTGLKGEKGDKGDKGDTGLQGAKGDKGDKGSDGITPIIQINLLTNEWEISVNNGLSFESTGVKATGLKGDTGSQGEKGDKGDKGDTGSQGEKGDKGDKGDTGSQGEKGDKGDKGDTGSQGEKGDKGDKGDAGVSVVGVALNDENKLVITLSEGDPIILDHSLMGETGAKGEKGDSGTDGVSVISVTLTDDFCLVFNYSDGTDSGKLGPIKGEKGDKGDTGSQGEKGEKGDTGSQGEKGDKGDKGDTGANGVGITTVSVDTDGNLYITYSNTTTVTLLGNIKGPKGDKGDTGAKGDKGDKGDTGSQGAKGDKGDTGKGIASIAFNENGELIITYTDDTTQNLGTFSSNTGDVINATLAFTALLDDTYSVSAGSEAAGVTNISIPSLYNGKPVSTIEKDAFSNLSNLISVTIPDSVTKIDENAFYNCESLTTITGCNGVTYIGNNSFANASNLKSFVIPESCCTIGDKCFSGDLNLDLKVESDNLNKIGAGAFSEVKSIIWESSSNSNWQFTVDKGQAWIYPYLPGDIGEKQYRDVTNQTFKVVINNEKAQNIFKQKSTFATNINYNDYWGNYKLDACPGEYVLTKQ